MSILTLIVHMLAQFFAWDRGLPVRLACVAETALIIALPGLPGHDLVVWCRKAFRHWASKKSLTALKLEDGTSTVPPVVPVEDAYQELMRDQDAFLAILAKLEDALYGEYPLPKWLTAWSWTTAQNWQDNWWDLSFEERRNLQSLRDDRRAYPPIAELAIELKALERAYQFLDLNDMWVFGLDMRAISIARTHLHAHQAWAEELQARFQKLEQEYIRSTKARDQQQQQLSQIRQTFAQVPPWLWTYRENNARWSLLFQHHLDQVKLEKEISTEVAAAYIAALSTQLGRITSSAREEDEISTSSK